MTGTPDALELVNAAYAILYLNRANALGQEIRILTCARRRMYQQVTDNSIASSETVSMVPVALMEAPSRHPSSMQILTPVLFGAGQFVNDVSGHRTLQG